MVKEASEMGYCCGTFRTLESGPTRAKPSENEDAADKACNKLLGHLLPSNTGAPQAFAEKMAPFTLHP